MMGVEKYFLKGDTRPKPLYVGSVKSNMGHSEPSSGVAALTKILLSYHYKKIPANINFNKPNPKVCFCKIYFIYSVLNLLFEKKTVQF